MSNDTHNTNMAERVLGAIEQSGVAPKPAWHFLLREWVVWVVAGAALLLGSLATALTLYITEASFFVERHIAVSDVAALFAMVPYLWLLLIGLGIFYTIHAVHATRRGYRFHTAWLVGIAIGASIAIGWSIHASGVSEALDRYLLAEMPMYQPLSGFQPAYFSDASQGVVAGVVTQVAGDSFTMQGLGGEVLQVRTASTTHVSPMLEIKEGMPLRITGTTTGSGERETFEASEVRPFHGRHGTGRGAGMGRGRPGEGVPPGSGREMHWVAPKDEAQ